MKKTLLPLAAFLALSGAAPTASAQEARKQPAEPSSPIQLELGGYMNWYGTYANQKRSTLVNFAGTDMLVPIGKYNSFDVMGSAEIYFSGSTVLDNGMKIGAMVQLRAGTDPDTDTNAVDQTYVTVDSGIGRIIVGNVKNVAYQMAVTSPNVSTIGVQETDFDRMVIMPAGFNHYDATYATFDDVSTKVSYITPTFAGFTAAVSLLPGNNTKGQDSNNLLFPISGNSKERTFRNGFVGVGLYQGDFGRFNLDASLSYASYKPNFTFADPLTNTFFQPGSKRIQEYAGGINVGMGNWTVGGSYRYVDAPLDMREFEGHVWDAGVSYVFGPVETSVNYLQSRVNNVRQQGKDEFSMYQVAGKYKLGAGVDTFVNVAYVEYDSADRARGRSNEGVAVATGMSLTF